MQTREVVEDDADGDMTIVLGARDVTEDALHLLPMATDGRAYIAAIRSLIAAEI